MAAFAFVKVENVQGGVDTYEWADPAAQTDVIMLLGTDTLSAAGLPVGGAREIAVEVVEVTTAVFVLVWEGTLDPAGAAASFSLVTDAPYTAQITGTDTGYVSEVLQPLMFIRPVLTTNTSGTITIRVHVVR